MRKPNDEQQRSEKANNEKQRNQHASNLVVAGDAQVRVFILFEFGNRFFRITHVCSRWEFGSIKNVFKTARAAVGISLFG
jgi:hypothetical protein